MCKPLTTDNVMRIAASLIFLATLLACSSAHSNSAIAPVDACADLSDWQSSSSPSELLAWQNPRIDVPGSIHVDDRGSRKFDVSLTSPSIRVSAAGLELRVTQQMQLSWANSAGVLEISIDNGEWTDIIEAGGHFEEGGYNLRAYSGNPIGMRPAWAGSPPAFKTRAVLPTQASNRVVRIRFRLGSGGTGDAHPGWSLREFRCS